MNLRSLPMLTFLLSVMVALLFLPTVVAQNCMTCVAPKSEIASGLTRDVANNAANSVLLDLNDVNDSWTIRRSVNEVTVFFSVKQGRKFVDDLTEQEVSITDDNEPVAKISSFGHQRDLPLRLGLLIDTSNSVNYRLDFEQETGRRFLRKIIREKRDEAFVAGFSSQTTLIQNYTDDPDKLAGAVSALHSGGSTALFDAVRASCWKLSRRAQDQPVARVLVLISDGDDNESRSTLEQAVETAQREEVTIYTVTINGPTYRHDGDRVMKILAAQTGGKQFSPYEPREVVKAFKAIEQEMRSRYMLAYQPADLREDGRFHRIVLKAQRSSKTFRVHARKGYYARLAFSNN